VNKAYNIDDTLFIEAAKQIQSNPTDFYGFTYNWYGGEMPMSKITKNPPLTSYYIALVASLFGWSEIVMHLAFLIPAIAVALGTYYLAQQFCLKPALAATITVLTPGFLISSTSIMCDVMMLAFWLWAIVLWMVGIKQNKRLALLFSALLIAVCVLTKYFGATLLVLLPIYTVVKKRKIGTWILFLLLPVLVLAAYQWLTHTLYGRGLLSDAATYATNQRWLGSAKMSWKALIGLSFTGGCMFAILFYTPLLWSWRDLVRGIIITVLLAAVVIKIGYIGRHQIRDETAINWVFVMQFILMVISGISVLILTFIDYWKSKEVDSLLLLLWVLGTFIFVAFINWSVNGRSVLPMIPAVSIVMVRRIEKRSAFVKLSFFKSVLPLVPAFIVVMLLVWADYAWANSSRSAVKTISEEFKNSHNTVWFQGHWGFQYYMEKEGHTAYNYYEYGFDFEKFRPAAEDVIVCPFNNSNVRSLPQESFFLKKSFEIIPSRWLATLNFSVGAGFYADIWGPMPFAAGRVFPEKYDIYAVKQLKQKVR
jgi:4-amino-4-deoxy-L-arabinose transferase-like glycosyltransferase